MHFFNISTSKSGPSMVCFDTSYFQMCFAPQRRALFQHRMTIDSSKSGPSMWLFEIFAQNVLRATTVCTFSTSQLRKVVRTWCVLYIFTSKCASRHNGVHFFYISTSKSGPSMVCFDTFDFQMCFAPQRRVIFTFSSAQMSPHPPL